MGVLMILEQGEELRESIEGQSEEEVMDQVNLESLEARNRNSLVAAVKGHFRRRANGVSDASD